MHSFRYCSILKVFREGSSEGGDNARGNFGGVAQLGEHLPCKQGVDSSILFISTMAEMPKLR